MKTSVSGPARIRQLNRTAVLAHIRTNGKNSRLQIGKDLGLSAAAITSVVTELLDEGLLRATELNKNTKDNNFKASSNKTQGRPISILELNPNKAYVFGILLRPVANKCVIESAWADYTGKVFTLTETIIVDTTHYQSIIDGIENAITNLKKQIPTKSKASGLSIGIPGVVENQKIPIAPKLKCIEDPEFISKLTSKYDYPISFENDVNLGAMSELQSQPRLRELSFAYLHLYSGVGSCIVLEGKILKGRRGWAGEIGLLETRNSDNQQTTFEQLLSVDGVLGDALEKLNYSRNELDSLVSYIDTNADNNVDNSIANKSAYIDALIENYCNELFNAINVIHSVIDLDEVVIDFPSSTLLAKLLPRVKKHIDQLQHPLDISIPTMEHQADLHGAALNALNLAIESVEKREVNSKK